MEGLIFNPGEEEVKVRKGSKKRFPAPATAAGGGGFQSSSSDADDGSKSLPSSPSSLTSESIESDSEQGQSSDGLLGTGDTSGSFMTAMDSVSSVNTKLIESLASGSSSINLTKDSEDNGESRNGSGPSSSNAGFSAGQFYGKSSAEYQILQTNEDHAFKEETDRGKRFEFLLQQTEIWGHFMKPAYEEALTFSSSEADATPGTSQASNEAGASSSSSTLAKGNGRGRAKGKKKLTVPNIPSTSDSRRGRDSTNHVTRFDSTPFFISGGIMRDYQVNGLNWMISLHERGLSGILADEMGLGKTLQAISLLGYLLHCRDIPGPHLIIAPKSTLPNWMNELSRWCPSLKAICLIGSKEERPVIIKKNFLPRRWNVCVTSYEIAKIEKATLAKVNYHYIVIDEAQKIKNENSLLSTGVRQFHSSNRLLLTGTPLQNNLHELWALLNFLLPDCFSSSEDFDSWFNESNCMGNQSLVDRLHAVLRPFLLRRIKSDVEKTLPPKSEMRLYVQLTPMQREWYRKVLMNDINVINDQTGRITRKALQNIIMHLRKVCNHPYLFDGAEPKPFTTDTHLVTNSGKMIVLDKLLLKVKAQGSRVLLFSQMTKVLDILEDYCIWRGFKYCRLDGNTDYDIRQEDIDAFNAPDSSKFIYLLSTRAGGLGINLASANIVIIYDSDWNPQMDLQAMDRAHRIGQTKEVKVFRFVVQDTLEEKIVERAASKLHLDRMVIQQGRLTAAGAKGPSAVEMLNVARFGADKILKSGENLEISDADIDTILAQSKLRSEEFDRRLNDMSEDNLKNLTIEQVELEWKDPAAVQEGNYFNFEGQNYRELRSRKAVLNVEDGIVEGKRRKDSSTLKPSRTDDQFDDQFDDSVSLDDLESASSVSSEGRAATPSKLLLLKKPSPPLDFQFCSPFAWEMYWTELDYFNRKSPQSELNLPRDLPEHQIQFLKAEEAARLQKCEGLKAVEIREKKILEGCYSWKKKDFRLFLQALIQHGCDDLQAVAKALKDKTEEDVVCYSQQFWLKCHELLNAEEILGKLGRTDVLFNRRKVQQVLLEKTSNNASDITYNPERWKGCRFSSEDDIQLLLTVLDIGLETPDVFGVLQSKLLKSVDDIYSPFLRTRTKEELHTRFNLLMHMIEAEAKTRTDKESSLPKIPSQEGAKNSEGRQVMLDEWVKITNKPGSSQSSISSAKSAKSDKDGVLTPGKVHIDKKRKRTNEEDNENDKATPVKASRT